MTTDKSHSYSATSLPCTTRRIGFDYMMVPVRAKGRASDAAQDDEGKESGDITMFNTGRTSSVGRCRRQRESERVVEGSD